MKLKYLVSACVLIASQTAFSASSRIKFSQAEIETTFNITHPVKSASLLDRSSKQLIVFGQNKENQRILSVIELQQDSQEYQEMSQLVIPENFLAFDLLKTNNKDKLIFQTNDELFEYSANENKFVSFAKIESIYLQEKTPFLVARDFIKDVNGDELDDIVIADFRHIHLLLQKNNGEYIRQSIPVGPKIEEDNDSSEFTERPLFFADMNQDNKTDLVVVRDNTLELYYQNGHSDFDLQAKNFPLSIDVKALNWWEIRETNGEFADQSKLSHRNMFDIRDLNNDKVSDLIVRFSQSDGVLDKQNNYEIYLGKIVNGKLSYSSVPDSEITADGTISALRIDDLNKDKKAEIIVDSLDIGVSQIIGALMTGSIDQDIYVFKMDDKDKYISKPMVEKEVELSFSISSGKSGSPVVQLADFDGDGIKDLMYSDGDDTLRIYQGTKKKKFLKRRSSKHQVQLPQDGQLLSVTDLNLDGKEDVVISYAREDEELKNKLVFLFAN